MTIRVDNSAFNDVSAKYRHQFDSRAEFEERVERAGAESGDWFEYATKPQFTAYRAAVADLAGDHFPRANRARDAAKASFHASTAEAAALCLKAFEDFMRDGEVHPDTAEAFEILAAKSEPSARNAHVAEPFRTILNALAGAA